MARVVRRSVGMRAGLRRISSSRARTMPFASFVSIAQRSSAASTSSRISSRSGWPSRRPVKAAAASAHFSSSSSFFARAKSSSGVGGVSASAPLREPGEHREAVAGRAAVHLGQVHRGRAGRQRRERAEVDRLQHVREDHGALLDVGQEEDLPVVAALLPVERTGRGAVEHLEAGGERVLDHHVVEVARGA